MHRSQVLGASGTVNFTCHEEKGAGLLWRNRDNQPILFKSADSLAEQTLAKYMVKHYKEWIASSRLDLRLENLILITGTYKVQDWVAASFSRTSEQKEITLGIDMASFGTTGIGFSRSLSFSPSAEINHGHLHPIDVDAIPSQASIPAGILPSQPPFRSTDQTSIRPPELSVPTSPRSAASDGKSGNLN